MENMKTDPMIHYWAHMLDESSHVSYYDMYMREHPEDKPLPLMKSLAKQFAEDLAKDNIFLGNCLNSKGFADIGKLERM